MATTYWRRGWLGYSNLDRRYEWVTIAPRVPMMIYLGKPGSGEQMPIDVTGVFTDQGVVNEQTVGKPVGRATGEPTLRAMIGRVDPKALRQTFKGDAVA